MKKILILGNHAEGLYNFRKELIGKLISDDFDVHYSVPEHPKVDRLKEIGGTYHKIAINRRGTNPLEDIKIFKYYYDLIKSIAPDIILTYTIKPNIYGGMVTAILKKPVIANITGLGSSLQKRSAVAYIAKKLYRLSLKKTNVIFFQNQENLDFFIKNKIISKHKAVLLPGSGVNTNEFHPVKKEKENDNIHFLFIGRIMREKGIHEFLNAAREIKEAYKNISFKIIGAYDEDRFKADIERMDKLGIVEYLGALSDVRDEINNSDCIVLPSYHEGMSNVLLEGAAMGKPLITTSVSGCKEIVVEDVNGFLCKPEDPESLKDAMIKFIESPYTKRKDMGIKSREKVVREFGRNIVIDQYMRSIESIIKEGY